MMFKPKKAVKEEEKAQVIDAEAHREEDAEIEEEEEEEHEDSGVDDGDEDEDLDAILENMDIDKDFDMWSNFRSSLSLDHGINASTEVVLREDGATADIHDVDTTIAAKTEKAAVVQFSDPSQGKWMERLQRDEIYSSLYRPSLEEEAELRDVEVLLGIDTTTTGSRFSKLFRSASSRQVTESEKSAWNSVARPADQQYPSLVLKRGPCLLQTGIGKDAAAVPRVQQECELILLTRGLAIAVTKSYKGKKSNVVPRQFHAAMTWDSVEFVQPCNEAPTAWMVHVQKNEDSDDNGTAGESSFTFACSDAAQRAAWLEAVETVLVRYHEYRKTRHDLGWQYQYIYKPGFTMAVTNRTDLDSPTTTATSTTTGDDVLLTKEMLNTVDDYNGLAPLHYAVRYNHVPAVAALLQAGADPNLKDGQDGHRTPMFWAVREQIPETTLALLEQYGATDREACVAQQLASTTTGELFGRVAETERIMEERHREERQKREAEAAANEIKNNLKLLQQRGEQIDQLGSGAADLNQGAQDFASMAKQLKEASKKNNSKWLPF